MDVSSPTYRAERKPTSERSPASQGRGERCCENKTRQTLGSKRENTAGAFKR